MSNNKPQRIIGISGSGDTASYLLSAPDKRDPLQGIVKQAQVLDLEQKTLFDPWPLNAIVARGYWEPFTGDQSIMPALLAQVQKGE